MQDTHLRYRSDAVRLSAEHLALRGEDKGRRTFSERIKFTTADKRENFTRKIYDKRNYNQAKNQDETTLEIG